MRDGRRCSALAHLRNGDTYTRLAAGFQVGVSTAWRYVKEAIALLVKAADDLVAAMQRIRPLAYAILDGTLIPIDRLADQKQSDQESANPRASPCGSRKLDRPAPAGEMYVGSYDRACARAAAARGGRVLIISAKHGLLDPATVIEPYDLRMGQPGSVTASSCASRRPGSAYWGRP